MDISKKQNTEFGKGQLDILGIMKQASKSEMKHYFVEQKEYSSTPLEGPQHKYNYLKKLG